MSPEPVRILVVYSHPLMGEGLERMLAAEPGLSVDAVDGTNLGAVDAAIARDPAIIVVEEGGPLDAAEVMRRSNCAVVLDVDITTTSAWSLRRETLSSRPDDFLAAIRGAVGSQRSDRTDAAPEPNRPIAADRGLRTAVIPG